MSIEDPDELEIAIAEPDQPIERAECVVAAAASRSQTESVLEFQRRLIGIPSGNNHVIDAEEHARQVT